MSAQANQVNGDSQPNGNPVGQSAAGGNSNNQQKQQKQQNQKQKQKQGQQKQGQPARRARHHDDVSRDFEPDEKTAVPGTSKYSQAYIEIDLELQTHPVIRAHNKFSQYFNSVILRLETSTVARYRKDHEQLLRETLDRVYDKIDSSVLKLETEKKELEAAIEEQKSKSTLVVRDVKGHGNPEKWVNIPVQSPSGLKWYQLLLVADGLIQTYGQASFAHLGADPIEMAAKKNAVEDILTELPNFVRDENDAVIKQIKVIEATNGRS